MTIEQPTTDTEDEPRYWITPEGIAALEQAQAEGAR